MKHERGMKELLGQNGTSGGNQDRRQAFTQASLSMGTTPRKEVEENRLKGKKVKSFVSISRGFLCILLSSIPCYSTEILIGDEGH